MPFFGDTRIDRINTEQVQQFIAEHNAKALFAQFHRSLSQRLEHGFVERCKVGLYIQEPCQWRRTSQARGREAENRADA